MENLKTRGGSLMPQRGQSFARLASLPVNMIALLLLLFVSFAAQAQVSNFAYTGAQQQWTAPATGWYRLETWGAQGGSGESYTVSRGGYSSGEVYLNAGTVLYIYVGGVGNYRTYGGDAHSTAVNTNGGWNGGGGVYNSAASHGSGGGATDIALTAGAMSLTDYSYRRTNASYLSRIIVAGGGAGNGHWQTGVCAGGGAEGLGMSGHFGTQSTAGASAPNPGAFGYGGRGSGGSGGGNGGGGGWYGGGGANGGSTGGGGGSGYVLTASSFKPSGYTPGSGYHMRNAVLLAGNQVMPAATGGGTTVGNSSNGYARISSVCGTLSGPGGLLVAGSANFSVTDITGGTWSSSNTAVATINASTGQVSGVSVGTTMIRYTVGTCVLSTMLRVHNTTTDFSYTGTEQHFVVPTTGLYKLEAWGAQGGTGESYSISRGGYATGEVILTAGTTLYVYVGGQGNYKTYGGSAHSTAVSTNGGWNGGGGVYNSAASHGTGGGGSDIALVRSDLVYTDYSYRRDLASYNSRILVAGGGAGNGNWQTGVYSGGGTTGIGPSGQVGTQTGSSTSATYQGSFGYGGRGQGSSGGGNGGGGGWYGGGAAQGGSAGGGGGSAYTLTASSHKPAGYSVGSAYYLSNTFMIPGNASMPNPAGGNMTGRSGHGLIRFTFLCPTAGTLAGNQDVPMGQTTTFTTNGTSDGTWSTSDASIATVDAAGIVTGVRNGTATITYTIAASGGCGISTATRTVNVTCTQAAAPSGSGTTADPYQVSNFAHLIWIAADNTRWDKHYIQTADIDASGSNCLGGGDGWLPIGNNTVVFAGSYNGQSHSITGIYSNRGAQTAIAALGLFGETAGAQISNLHVLNSNITGSENVGAVVGYARGNTVVTNVHSSGIIRSVGTSGIAGGAIGWLTAGSLSQSSSTATVSVAADGGRAGGIVGYAKQTTITRSFANGRVSSSGSDGSIGGFIGDALNTTITECYALGSLTNNGSVLNLGGLLGSQMGGAVNNSYAAVAINSATGTKGGLVATKVSGAITNSYYDSDISQQTGNTNGTALTTAQLKSYTTMIPNGWDMQCERINGNTDTWGMNPAENGGYPFLSWESRTAQCPEWTGQTSSSFTTPSNWVNGLTPLSGMDIVFNGSASNDLALTQHWTTGRIVFNGSGQKMELGNFNLTMLGNGIDANASNYVKTSGSGRMVATIQNGEEFMFPVGYSSYNPVTIKNHTGSADQFSVFIGDQVYENGTGGNALNFARVNRTWDIHKANPNSGDGIDITLGWSADDQSAAITTPWLYHYSGGRWHKLFDEQVAGSNSLHYKNYKGSFSPFAVLESSFILPVTWLNFTATKQQDNVLLKWSTASEQNTRDFVIQHSLDGTSWTNAGQVAAAGNSTTVKNYNWLHVKPVAGTNYYRILQRDLDGKESYSRIVAVQLASKNSLSIYPNPSADGIVKMQLPEGATVKVFNLNGAIVWQKTLQAGLHTIDLSKQAKGVYMVKVGDKLATVLLQ